ncbi:MAG: RluA family pseudouridine synthase [Candidatus Eisenbacteria bacterium]|uniref:Pseudouridine synthase n=1 Tax=Eiseniibacteriota bacterium TaxID=2212470 RepID=A0A849SY82_UNCEI|nr:RluA family pseudouridine synthase [Candidatus Eisenbacteria bacterium]
MAELQRYSVDESMAGQRIDRFLAAAQHDLSRSAIQHLIEAGSVRVNGAEVRASHRLRLGEEVVLQPPPDRVLELIPEDLPIAVVHEDEDVIVIEKPAGLVVHPGAGVRTGTLVHALLHRYPEIATVGGPGRPGIVHRLDRDTTGLMVVARSARAYRVLVESLRARHVKRGYGVLIWGDPREAQGTVEARIGRDPHVRTRMAVVRGGGRVASTRWRVEERFGTASRVSAQLGTGRTHQIRVHFAHLGFPVIGDPLYGGRKKELSRPAAERSLATSLLSVLGRQALHAEVLEFHHPVRGSSLSFRSPWPADLARALALLREGRNGTPPTFDPS